jgi:hypothetical protein
MRSYWLVCAAAVLALGLAGAVFADDFSPAPWRGQALTVAAEWEFVNSNLTDLPPDYINTVGDGIHPYNTNCYVHTHPQMVYWEPDPTDPNDGRAFTQGVPGQLLFFLCNFIDDYQHKYIWVQLTYGGQGVPYVYQVLAPNPGTNEWTYPMPGTLVERNVQAGHATEMWELGYNPDREYVNVELPPFTWLDQIWIETISTDIPVGIAPSTWGQVKILFR